MTTSDNVIGVNLKTIASGFSGAILFDGEGSVEIIETDGYFTFSLSFKPVGESSNPDYKTIASNVDLGDHVESLTDYNLYDLVHRKEERATFSLDSVLKEVYKLTPNQRGKLLEVLQDGLESV